MAIAMMVDNPDGSQEVYVRVREVLGLERATSVKVVYEATR